jgi:tripartite-type tricarboxylate transporter receptor subunit TctC
MAFAASLACGTSLAAAWPDKPIRFVVPFAPGGSTDLMAREVAQGVSASIGQPIVVENRPGAASTVGTGLVARMPADGYSFLVTSSHFSIVPHLYKNLPYDAAKDFAPVTLLCTLPVILVVHPEVPAKNVQELIALAKSKPLNFASSGSGGVAHLSGELFKALAGVDIRHVPYKGGGPAMSDLLGGHVQLMFDAISTSMPHIRSGALRPLAWTGSTRSSLIPDLPTIAESGVPGYASSSWLGMFAPAGTPPEIVQRMSKEVRAVLDRPEVRQRQLALGVEIAATTPEQFTAQLKDEFPKWEKLIRESGAKVD